MPDYLIRLHIEACLLLQSLNKQVIVLVTNDSDAIARACKLHSHPLHVLTLSKYLSERLGVEMNSKRSGDLNTILAEYEELYQVAYGSASMPSHVLEPSSSVVLDEQSSVSSHTGLSHHYSPHCPADLIQSELRDGELYQGRFLVYKQNNEEAEVELASSVTVQSSAGRAYSSILIRGRADGNRALDGDTVVVRVRDSACTKTI